jgi:hypothetical protein
MKSIFMIALLAATAALWSCNESKKEGDWDDNIQLSQKSAEFKAVGDSIIITTKGEWWWITDIAVNGTYYYNFSDVDLEANSYVIAQDGFVVERRNKTTLVVKLDANPLNTARVVKVGLEAGDYFDSVTITQKASE